MKTGWLVYDEGDLKQNQAFADHMTREGLKRELELQTVRTTQLKLGVKAGGALMLTRDGRETLPDFVISRQRDSLLSAQFERLGVPVFNGSKVCDLCNDKRKTHQFLAGLPMLATRFVSHRYAVAPPEGEYPLVVKPAQSHGGDRVQRVANEYEWREAVDEILPMDIIEQQLADGAGRDLRVYVLFGQIVAAVLRTAKEGIISNFKRGGAVEPHSLTPAEKALAESVIARFENAGAPLCMAGVDLLYHQGAPVVSEVEDVVGSRMLYRTSDMDIAGMYLDGIAKRV
ncbi:MAG: ATP-grasp domain-containing protein [Eubacteriales bacterium]|nr:ATP-grasp domain-containing protein [Eubacteriales bacterium]